MTDPAEELKKEEILDEENDNELEVVVEGEDDPKEENKASEKPKDTKEEFSDEEKQSQSKENRRKSRARDRIQQLNRKTKEQDGEIARLREELKKKETGEIELQRQYVAQSKSNAETLLNSLEDQLAKAVEAGDYKKQVEVSRKITEATVDLRVAQAQETKLVKDTSVEREDSKEKEVVSTKENDVDLPEKLQDWLDENPWFFKNRRMQVYATTYADELKQEGINEDEDEFYEKLDEEIRSRFPDQFGEKGSDGVELGKNKNSTSQEPTGTESEKGSGRKPSPVTGASRTPSSRKNRVTLTKQEAEFADRLGIPRERYALRKKAKEESPDGWVEI